MKAHFLPAFIFLFLLFSFERTCAQDKSVTNKKKQINKVADIPHGTTKEKWMWPHRCITFFIIRERPVAYDTAYIKSHYKRLVISLPVSTRFLRFSLIDFKSGNRLNFLPNMQSDLGISVSSRWASFIVNTGIKVFNKDSDFRGKTKSQDYQLNLYGRKITTDMFFQFYKGFYIRNSRSFPDYVSDRPFATRSDVSASNMGVSSYFMFNHKKFSYGSAFSFVEIQKKSAGSPLLGIYYTYFNAEGNPSLISEPFRNSFDTLSLIRRGQTQNFGINIGYIYTLVVMKKFFATASLTQGLGLAHVSYKRDDYSSYQQFVGGTGKTHARFSIRYDNGRYFIGAMGMMDNFLFLGKKNSTFDYSFGKFMAFIGFRFSVLKPERKLLRKMGLIDY